MPFIALLDACVLVPITLADTLLRAAEAYTYQLIWSEQILTEVRDTLVGPDFNLNPQDVEDRVDAMRQAFRDATVEDYEDLISAMRVAPEDRHVAAAAVVGHAQVIVTQNTGDFPPAALERYRIAVQDPDTFLLHLFDLDPDLMANVIRWQAADLTDPPKSPDDVCDSLAQFAPQFAAAVREQIRIEGRG